MSVPGLTHRTIIKVCGITRLADAHHALASGADWLGLILKGDSPRLIGADTAARIVAGAGEATTVAVMVSPTPEEAIALAARAGTRRVQLHHVDPTRWPADFALPACFVVPVAEDGRLTNQLPGKGSLLMLDAADNQRAGGTGRTFPWETAARLSARRPVMLAGGLGPDNVADAIGRVRPFGVDASSRLESAPGIKDPDRVRRFIAAVRRCDLERTSATSGPPGGPR